MFPIQMDRTTIFGIAAAVMFWSNAMAQTVVDSDGTETDATDPTIVTGTETGTGEDGDINPFDELSPGNQKITESLFDAQQAEDGDNSWSLDEIATAKQEGTGWGNVFKQMKEDGLVEEMNLGQIISGQGKTGPAYGDAHTNKTNTARAAFGRYRKLFRSDVVVTTANGGRVVVGLVKPGHRQRPSTKARVNRTSPGGARKVTLASRRLPGRQQKLPGTLGRVNQAQVTAVRSAFAARAISTGAGAARISNTSHPRGTRGRKAK